MSQFRRGTVVKLSLTVEYPDGSTHQTELENPQNISKLVFHESELSENEHGGFCVSLDDWKRNPSMIIFRTGDKIKPGDVDWEPWCSHHDHND